MKDKLWHTFNIKYDKIFNNIVVKTLKMNFNLTLFGKYILINRVKFQLTLPYSLTIHKAQGRIRPITRLIQP